MFFEIVKKFNNINKDEIIGLGQAIDIFDATKFEEGNYVTEYLVDKRFLTKSLKEKCNMELIETGMFDTIFNINKGFFNDTYKHESIDKTKKFFEDAVKFYRFRTIRLTKHVWK